ncbi:hypothetical protein [Burkholderia ambifaria]|uniref:hypothetical protein n=1 Tax=Burkholderia ambifaria TaxID=152480 RepID=UPI001FC8E68F|nr:hypothetical protein [Burkholderia ambifaria]
MQNVLTAPVSIVVLILARFVLRQRRLLPDEFWPPCETLNYYYMFPALMFSQVAKANLTQFPVRPIRRISQDQIFIAKITIWYTHRQALKSRILLPVATPAISTLFRKPAR